MTDTDSLVDVLDAALKANDIATLALAGDGRVVAITHGFFLMTGLAPEACRWGTLDALVAGLREAGATGNDLAALLQHDVEARGEQRGDLALSDGRILEWTRLGSDAGVRVWTFRNVGVERHNARALTDGERWLRMFAAHVDGMVFEVDAEARIVGLWSRDTTFFDSWHEDLSDRTLVEAFGTEVGPLYERCVRTIVATGRPESFEYVDERQGAKRVFAVSALLLPAETGAPPTVTVVVRDVTERVLMQRKLLQSERLASLGLLAAGVAHEVNNPVAYMLLNMQRVLRVLHELSSALHGQELGRTLSELGDGLRIAVEGATRVQEVVSDLRKFSRSDEHEPSRVVDVRDVLAFTLGMMGAEIGKQARVVRQFGSVPMVLAGEGRLHQVFLNLIINAVQAIEERGSAENEIRLVTLTDGAGNAVVEVHDTGCGISEAHLSRVFDPFFTTKPASIGTGLGLAICHGITTSLRGQLTVSSRVGAGSVFRVILPPTSTVGA